MLAVQVINVIEFCIVLWGGGEIMLGRGVSYLEVGVQLFVPLFSFREMNSADDLQHTNTST